MDKSSEKKPIIPEMNIPDVANYQPSDSALAKFATRTYVFARTQPRILAVSITALALTGAAFAFISAPNGPTTLPPLEATVADVSATDDISKQTAPTTNDKPAFDLNIASSAPTQSPVDNTIEEVDTEEFQTSVKPFTLPVTPETTVEAGTSELNAEHPAPTSPVVLTENVVNQNDKTARAQKDDSVVVAPEETSVAELANIDFSKRFGETLPPMTEGEAQQALKDSLARIGSIEQSMNNLKSFPFDLIVKPTPDAPKYALLKIIQGAEATSGFWREVEDPAAKPAKGKKKPVREEHFLVLQAVDEATDKPVEVDVKDMDSGETKKENSWAVLIPEKQFLDFAQSKHEDGTFSKPVLGKINLETGEIEWEIDTDGRALINWKEFAE